jgi:DNA-binding protein HU-beta
MTEIKSRWKRVADRERWGARGASFVAKVKATKVVWFPPKPVETGSKAASTAKKATSRASKKTTGAAKKTTGAAAKRTAGAAKKTTSRTKKVTDPVGLKKT